MKLEKLPWSGIGPDPNKVRERRILSDHLRREEKPERYVIELVSETVGGDKDYGWYDATDAVFTDDPARVTLFLDRRVATAVLGAFTSKRVRLARYRTRLVKGVRVPVGLPR